MSYSILSSTCPSASRHSFFCQCQNTMFQLTGKQVWVWCCWDHPRQLFSILQTRHADLPATSLFFLTRAGVIVLPAAFRSSCNTFLLTSLLPSDHYSESMSWNLVQLTAVVLSVYYQISYTDMDVWGLCYGFVAFPTLLLNDVVSHAPSSLPRWLVWLNLPVRRTIFYFLYVELFFSFFLKHIFIYGLEHVNISKCKVKYKLKYIFTENILNSKNDWIFISPYLLTFG